MKTNIIIMSHAGETAGWCRSVNNEISDRILKAFTAIHEHNVRHQNLSLRNFLIDKDGRVAIVDLERGGICDDCAAVVGEQERIRRACGEVKTSGSIRDFKL